MLTFHELPDWAQNTSIDTSTCFTVKNTEGDYTVVSNDLQLSIASGTEDECRNYTGENQDKKDLLSLWETLGVDMFEDSYQLGI